MPVKRLQIFERVLQETLRSYEVTPASTFSFSPRKHPRSRSHQSVFLALRVSVEALAGLIQEYAHAWTAHARSLTSSFPVLGGVFQELR